MNPHKLTWFKGQLKPWLLFDLTIPFNYHLFSLPSISLFVFFLPQANLGATPLLSYNPGQILIIYFPELPSLFFMLAYLQYSPAGGTHGIPQHCSFCWRVWSASVSQISFSENLKFLFPSRVLVQTQWVALFLDHF